MLMLYRNKQFNNTVDKTQLDRKKNQHTLTYCANIVQVTGGSVPVSTPVFNNRWFVIKRIYILPLAFESFGVTAEPIPVPPLPVRTSRPTSNGRSLHLVALLVGARIFGTLFDLRPVELYTANKQTSSNVKRKSKNR